MQLQMQLNAIEEAAADVIAEAVPDVGAIADADAIADAIAVADAFLAATASQQARASRRIVSQLCFHTRT